MKVSDMNGVFINHLKVGTNSNGKRYATFSIAYSNKVGANKFKSSFVDGITSFENIIKKLEDARETDRFVFEGKLNSNDWKTDSGESRRKVTIEIHTLTPVVNPAYKDPYSDPSAPLLQDDPYQNKTLPTMPGEATDEDLPF